MADLFDGCNIYDGRACIASSSCMFGAAEGTAGASERKIWRALCGADGANADGRIAS